MPENRAEPRNLIFLHIPKAAGSTLQAVINRQYDDDDVYRITTEPSVKASVATFRDLPRSRRMKIRCVMGHGPFGLHQDLVGSTEYVTLLRDPVSRIISLYHYACRTEGHRHHDVIEKEDMSLRDYVTSGMNEVEIRNGMTRQIAGLTDEVSNQKALEQARQNLRGHFGVVGLVERFDESLLLMKHRYGWGKVVYRRHRTGIGRPKKEDIPDRTLREIRRRNHLDRRLYRFAKGHLEERLKESNLGRELWWHRLRCRLYSLTWRWKAKAKKSVRALVFQ